MKVVYDYQIFDSQEYGGISRYFYEVSRRVAASSSFHAWVVAPTYVNRYLDPRRVPVLGLRVPRVPRTHTLLRAANRLAAPALLGVLRPNVVHETYYRRGRRRSSEPAVVLTVYDMIHELFPTEFNAAQNTTIAKRAAVARADHVVCISGSTRRDLCEVLDVPERKTSVIHLAGSLSASCPQAVARSSPRPYILFVGARGGYKNFSGFVRAYSTAPALRRELGIVCFGGGPFCDDERELLSRCGLRSGVVEQTAGGDTELAAVYSGATVLVCPSLYEGFGIPVLEAMSLGCPVACANTSSLPEVVGEAAVMFDPTDPEAMRASLESLAFNSEVRQDYIARGRRRAALFSWDRCAEETMRLYERVVG